ncbi:S41 family peptidase [Chryseobacterium sp. B21-037]|uniref:S41 family peptidase n=1 Tax=unclassified Chryseobacterium TaxID=2593645 RepID=UPI002358621F|nr:MULTISPECIES: S41 family peptidase [unclassified Chryseobacterium]MDC8104411.1 S41 family peptidase [Chryseobacterium sp. B21-037]MDQ1804026.1 S41 family peptidase [Chryseobacterium sp. CKR4-1]
MKITFILFGLIFLWSCSSLTNSERQEGTLIEPEQLKKDVDYAYTKLKEMHPQLYRYITRKDLDFKIDSIKQTINEPLTPTQFYFKLQPVITSIREGHLSLMIPFEKLKREYGGRKLFTYFKYYIKDDHLYIVANKDSIQNIKPGTEILSINNIPISFYISKYRKLISSDGRNTTFTPYYLKDMFFVFFSMENGFLEQVKIETLYNNKKQTFIIERDKQSEAEKAKSQTQANGSFHCPMNRNFKFLDENNSIAYINIKKFSNNKSDRFYKNTFERIKEAKSDYLILDIRNNYGGSLQEINNLYSYLVSEPFTLIKPSRLNSGYTPLKTNYFKKSSPLEYALKGITYPTYFFLKTLHTYKGNDGKFYYKIKADNVTKPNKNAFHGKIFVLVNGGSYSASSIISSKLKFDKVATLVGEETGGANDGTVAGFYSYQVLPNSKLTLPIGLLLVNPNITLTNSQRGVIPDVTITETLLDIINKNDVQLAWVKKEIEKEKARKIK